MTEVRYDKSHHAGGTPEARIASRLRNSGDTSGPRYQVVGYGAFVFEETAAQPGA